VRRGRRTPPGVARLAGGTAAALFALVFLGAALLAMAIVPLSRGYSICEPVHLPAYIDDKAGQEPVLYASYGALPRCS
jgi:hypothetical protein